MLPTPDIATRPQASGKLKPTVRLTGAALWFFSNAGWSHIPGKETPAQGKTRTALALAEAEDLYLNAHRIGNVQIVWGPDRNGARDSIADGQTFGQCEFTALYIDGHMQASIGGILDATDNTRRIFRAELALEAQERLTHIIMRG